jgi:hypothetical protein
MASTDHLDLATEYIRGLEGQITKQQTGMRRRLPPK